MKFKSLVFIAAASFAVVGVSCQQSGSKKIKLETAADSVSYSIGILVADNMKQNLESAPSGSELNKEILAEAFKLYLNGGEAVITPEKANEVQRNYFMKVAEKEAQNNLEAGNAFLEKNKSREGVKITASGLQYEVLKEGAGAKPTAADNVKVHYHGTLIDGSVFDSSVDRGEPATFQVNQVIPGWTEALLLMPVGSKYKIYLPSDLAYGQRGSGGKIGPNTVLIFEVELLEIVK